MDFSLNNKARRDCAELKDENVRALAKSRGITEEQALFSLMKKCPALFGAMQDWDDVKPICIAVMRELKGYLPFRDIFEIVLRVLNYYDTQVICVLRVFSDVQRLAYFVNEMIESMLEVAGYAAAVKKEFSLHSQDRLIMRGIVLKRITSVEVQKTLINDKMKFFKAEERLAAQFLTTDQVSALPHATDSEKAA